jgi:hypothetical protein
MCAIARFDVAASCAVVTFRLAALVRLVVAMHASRLPAIPDHSPYCQNTRLKPAPWCLRLRLTGSQQQG